MIDNSSSRPARPSLADRLERAALILVLVVVAILAGKVAFGRVVGWTMANSPEATPDNAGWTNGVISELLPIGVLLFMRHQKRHDRRPGTLAWAALVGACLFSLTAQLAQAVPSVSGWIVAAVPSVAFAILSKMVVSMRPTQESETQARDGEAVAVVKPTVPKEPEAEASCTPDVKREPVGELQFRIQPESEPGALTTPASEPRKPSRTRPRSLTSRTSVERAAHELGPTAMPAVVAAHAGVSESTARRYMPARSPMPAAVS